LNDLLSGGPGNDFLDGGAGDNVLIGGGGHDVLKNGHVPLMTQAAMAATSAASALTSNQQVPFRPGSLKLPPSSTAIHVSSI
jgi:hypothetical protein